MTTRTFKWKAPAMRLINSAEKLIGQHGVDGVTLLDIAKAAGQANKYAVQYHFGSKENLLRAVFETRLAVIGEQRQNMLQELRINNSINIRNLLKTMIYPVYELVGDDGLHHYAQFTSKLMDSQLAGEVWFNQSQFQITLEIKDYLKQLTPHLTLGEFEIRVSLISEMLGGALRIIDRNIIMFHDRKKGRQARNKLSKKQLAVQEKLLSSAIEMAAIVLESAGTEGV